MQISDSHPAGDALGFRRFNIHGINHRERTIHNAAFDLIALSHFGQEGGMGVPGLSRRERHFRHVSKDRERRSIAAGGALVRRIGAYLRADFKVRQERHSSTARALASCWSDRATYGMNSSGL